MLRFLINSLCRLIYPTCCVHCHGEAHRASLCSHCLDHLQLSGKKSERNSRGFPCAYLFEPVGPALSLMARQKSEVLAGFFVLKSQQLNWPLPTCVLSCDHRKTTRSLQEQVSRLFGVKMNRQSDDVVYVIGIQNIEYPQVEYAQSIYVLTLFPS